MRSYTDVIASMLFKRAKDPLERRRRRRREESMSGRWGHRGGKHQERERERERERAREREGETSFACKGSSERTPRGGVTHTDDELVKVHTHRLTLRSRTSGREVRSLLDMSNEGCPVHGIEITFRSRAGVQIISIRFHRSRSPPRSPPRSHLERIADPK